jgi:hypothetical protein
VWHPDAIPEDEGHDGHDEPVEEKVGEETHPHGGQDEERAGAPADARGRFW